MLPREGCEFGTLSIVSLCTCKRTIILQVLIQYWTIIHTVRMAVDNYNIFNIPACSVYWVQAPCKVSCGKCGTWSASLSDAGSKSSHHQTPDCSTCMFDYECDCKSILDNETFRRESWSPWGNLLIGVALWGNTHQHHGLDCFFFFLPIFLPRSWLDFYCDNQTNLARVYVFQQRLQDSQIWNGNGLCPWLQYSAVSICRDK